MSKLESEFNLLPSYKIGIGEFNDGLVINVPYFCRYKNKEKCKKFYEKIFCLKSGLYVCPYGFNTYIYNDKEKNIIEIFTGFRVKGQYNKNKADNKIKREDNNTIITYDQMNQYIEKYIKYIEIYNKERYLEKFINNTIHDIRKFNANIKTKSSLIINKSTNRSKKNLKEIKPFARNIWAMSSYISTRLDTYNYLYSKESYSLGEKYEFNFYKVFDKIRMCLKGEANKKNIDIKLSGTCESIKAYNSIELIPFLIIDNAIKYTLKGETINISINQVKEIQKVIIEAYGAKIEKNEIGNIFKREYRGKYAKKYNNDGSGIGLYLVKQICDANNIKINVESGEGYLKKDDSGVFKLTLSF